MLGFLGVTTLPGPVFTDFIMVGVTRELRRAGFFGSGAVWWAA